MNLDSHYQNELIKFIFQKPGSRLALEQFPDVQRSIDIYRNNLFENAARALAITFPSVESLMGRKAFRTLVAKLLESETKTQFDWGEYGQTFPSCIEEQEALLEYPYLSEVAQFDWLNHQTQRMADIPAHPETFQLLEQVPLNELVFDLNVGFSIHEFWFPVTQLQQLANPSGLSEADINDLQINIAHSLKGAINLEHARSILVWRPAYKMQSEVLTKQSLSVYQSLVSHRSVEQVFNKVQEQSLDLSEWLSDAISSKKVIGIKRRSPQ